MLYWDCHCFFLVSSSAPNRCYCGSDGWASPEVAHHAQSLLVRIIIMVGKVLEAFSQQGWAEVLNGMDQPRKVCNSNSNFECHCDGTKYGSFDSFFWMN
mmetsp:Transcript_8804/g.12766  ORF Transcript_8804/g.12766 Transcript_8804/m.12766 type:complete len:99 (+) Transcript_8804:273-569(+)